MSVDCTSGDYSVAIASPLTSTSFGVTCWAFMPSGSGSDWTLVSIDNGTTVFIQIARQSTGPTHYWSIWSDAHSGGSAGIELFTEASALGVWVFLAISGAPTTSTVYWSVNFAAISSQTIESSASGATKFWVGNDGFGTGFFHGQVESVKLWSGSLTLAQITNEFEKGPPINYVSQWLYWPLLNSASGAVDWSGNARNGATSGTPSTSTTAAPVPWDRNQNIMGL